MAENSEEQNTLDITERLPQVADNQTIKFSLVENKWVVLFAFLGLYTLLHVLLYRFNPLVGDDGLLSSLRKNQNLVLEIKNKGELVLPEGSFDGGTNPSKKGVVGQPFAPTLVYRHDGKQYSIMNRHYQGGMIYNLMGTISKRFDPINSLTEIHLVANLLGLLLFGLLLIKMAEPAVAFFGLVFFVLDPVNILPYGHYFSEQFYRPILFGGLLLAVSDKRLNWLLGGLLLSFGVYVKLTIVFYYMVAGILFFNNLKTKRGLYLCSGILIGGVAFLLSSDMGQILNEIKKTPLDLNFSLIAQDLFHMIAQKRNFLLPLTDENFFSNLKLNNWYYFSPKIYSILLAGFFMLPLLIQMTPYRKLFNYKFYLRVYFAFAVFVGVILVVARNQYNYYTFLFGISPLTSYLLARSARDFWIILRDRFGKWQKDLIFWTLLILPSLYNVIDFGFYFSRKGLVMRHDGELASRIVEDLSSQGMTHPFTISNYSQGLYEFLSKGEVRPYHLGDFIRKERFPSFPLMLQELREGTIVLPIHDQTSQWYWSWNHDLNPNWWLKKLREHGIMVVNHFIYESKGVPKAWRLTFKSAHP